MEHQYHIEMPANVELPKTTIAQAFFPISRFHYFHRDANINFQLNRLLIPGLEDMFAEIGRYIENFDDWKNLFFAKAAAFEKRAIRIMQWDYTVLQNFLRTLPTPNRKMVFEKYLRFFYQSKEGKNLERISVPYGNNHLHGFRLTPTIPTKGIILIHGRFDSYSEQF